jgi:hypothetical protein
MLPAPVQIIVKFSKAQFAVQFPKTVQHPVLISTGVDHQFLNLNMSLVLWMDRLGSFSKALTKESMVTSLLKMAPKS